MRNAHLNTHWGWAIGATIFCSLAAFSGHPLQDTGVTGKVVPSEGVERIWAAQANETVAGVAGTTGDFIIKAKPGTWRVVVDAKEPYQDVIFERVVVNDGKTTHLGDINLQQQ